jgi:purine-binding chemotaxis protein CheW
MPETDQSPAASEKSDRRFVTFRTGERLYAVSAADISEVIRVPAAARVPQGPKALLGLANLRGSVVPLLSLRALLGQQEITSSPVARAVVLAGSLPVALAVDAVDALVTVQAEQIESRQAELAAEAGERLQGAFRSGAGQTVAKILDVPALLNIAFAERARAKPQVKENSAVLTDGGAGDQIGEERQKLMTFEVAGQEYGLALDIVHEIIAMPEAVTAVPLSEALVLGVVAFRNGLLPLLSLRALLGFPPAAPDGHQMIVVTAIKGVLAGLVADRMRSIVAAESGRIEPIPPVLAARTGGEARIKAIYRGEDGRRLISILHPDQLFREDVMKKLGSELDSAKGRSNEQQDANVATHADELQFLVFRLGDDEFALPIDAVDEVARVPDQITRVPKTPRFLEGVVNLRGEVLPVVDQRKRFDMAKAKQSEGRRLVVVRTERHRAGLIVDSVSEVLRQSSDRIKPAPNLTEETSRLIHGVINMEEMQRIVLVLDPSELLSRAERTLLDAFESRKESARL